LYDVGANSVRSGFEPRRFKKRKDEMRYVTTIGDREYPVEVIDEHHVILDGKSYEVDFDDISNQPIYSLLVDGKSYEAYVYPINGSWQVLLHGRSYPVLVEGEMERRMRISSAGVVSDRAEFYLKAPMPGLVISVRVNEGQEVQKGDVLVVLESMKMQNELKSPRAGLISRLRVHPGDSVEQHETMLSVQ
jgi:acetyl/propionyl-CoA carboxylase alpha subunit